MYHNTQKYLNLGLFKKGTLFCLRTKLFELKACKCGRINHLSKLNSRAQNDGLDLMHPIDLEHLPKAPQHDFGGHVGGMPGHWVGNTNLYF